MENGIIDYKIIGGCEVSVGGGFKSNEAGRYARTVLDYINKKGTINNDDALNILNIPQLQAPIYSLRHEYKIPVGKFSVRRIKDGKSHNDVEYFVLSKINSENEEFIERFRLRNNLNTDQIINHHDTYETYEEKRKKVEARKNTTEDAVENYKQEIIRTELLKRHYRDMYNYVKSFIKDKDKLIDIEEKFKRSGFEYKEKYEKELKNI